MTKLYAPPHSLLITPSSEFNYQNLNSSNNNNYNYSVVKPEGKLSFSSSGTSSTSNINHTNLTHLYNNNSNNNSNNNNKNQLYKQISPRKRFDKFGIDKTDYKAFTLSNTVYPTAVKTTLLVDLHDSSATHKCGFDIVDRPTTELSLSLGSKASSVINVPPPTAINSLRSPGSTHSAPIVAFVESTPSEINSNNNNMPGTRRTSVNSKGAINAAATNGGSSGSDVILRNDDVSGIIIDKQNTNKFNKMAMVGLETGGMSDDFTSSITQKLNNQTTENDYCQNKSDIGDNGDGSGEEEEVLERAATKEGNLRREILMSSNKLGGIKFTNAQKRNHTENPSTPGRGKENRLDGPKVTSYSKLENARLIRYQWMSKENRMAVEKKDGGDIRDPMYINTFCADERPVRFNKTSSLPRLSKTSRRRPWTVGESNISNRMANLVASRQSVPANFNFGNRPSTKQHKSSLHQSAWNIRYGHKTNNASNTNASTVFPSVQKPNSGGVRIHQISNVKIITGKQAGKDCGDDWVEEDEDRDEEDEEDQHTNGMPLLEIRSCHANNSVVDQRDKLKGKDGCLNSRVKQCVRFVRYRERLDKENDHRPLKSESGRYRPFSKTDVRSHNLVNPPPTPELKLQQSVETYQKYIENIARQTNMSSPRHPTFRSHSNDLTRPVHVSVPTTPSARDPDSMIVQSVMNSNRPDSMPMPIISDGRILASDTPRPQNSAIYTKDVSSVGHVLDIKRISPKLSTNRIVPGTRVAYEMTPSAWTPRQQQPAINAEEVEGRDEESEQVPHPAPSSSRGNAIVVPMGGKSECASEYSMQ